MVAVVSSAMGNSVVGNKEVVPVAKTTSQWDMKRHIAFSHVAHLGVDSVLFALRLRAGSMDAEAAAAAAAPRKTGTAADQEDPAARGRRNRDRERANREAKRKRAAAEAAGASKARLEEVSGTITVAAATAAAVALEQDAPCKNKSCVRRGTMEDKLEARWEQVTEELGAKIKGVQKLRQSVDEVEKRRDAALEEIASLKEAGDAEAAWAEQRKQRLQASEAEERRILEESQRLEVELRKLRTRYQEETQQRLPMPHGSIISEADAWAKAAAASTSRTANPLPDEGGEAEGDEGEEEGQPSPPPPFVSDGLTVSFSPRTRHEGPRASQRLYHRAGDWSEGLTRPSGKEHPGRFGRWGPDTAREQWSCCLWEEADTPSGGGGGDGGGESRNGGFDTDGSAAAGGGNQGSGPEGRRRGGGVASGCEVVRPHPDPGGTTTADDVHLVWRRSERDVRGDGVEDGRNNGNSIPRIRHEAWGADRGGQGTGDREDRELWRPMLARRISGAGAGGGAAWSLIGHSRRPQTANARMIGRRPVAPTASATPAGKAIDGIAPGPKQNSSLIGSGGAGGIHGGGGGGCSPASLGALRSSGSSGFRRRPGSAPPPATDANRQRQHQHHHRRHPHKNRALNGPSPLMNLRSARAKAGWQRQRPTSVGTSTRGLLRSSFRTNRNNRNGIQCDLAGNTFEGGVSVDGRGQQRSRICRESSLRSRSLTSLNAVGSSYSVYSKGEGRGVGAAAAAAATTVLPSDRGGGARRP